MVKNLELKAEKCYCPGCEQTYLRMVEPEHADSPFAYRHNGHLVIYHDKCRHSYTGRQFMKGVNNA